MSLEDSFKQQAAEDNHYINIYNRHYNNDNGLLPLYQLPSKKISDILTYIPFKLSESAGLVGITYGILDKDIDTVLIGGSVALFGLFVEIGLLPLRRIIRGKIISQKRGDYHKI